MHRLFDFLQSRKCAGLHQKLALESLRGIEGDAADRWQSLYLWRIEPFLRGVDAPVEEFRDFANHSFDPSEPWGTAPRLAAKWYEASRESFRSGDWSAGVYHTGIVLRYASCALLLFHGRHRGPALARRGLLEWCLARHFAGLTADDGARGAEAAMAGWEGGDLESFLATVADAGRVHEERVFERLTAKSFSSDPPRLEDGLRADLAAHLRTVSGTLGAIVRRLTDERTPPPRRLPIGFAYGAALPAIPIFWITRSRAVSASRRQMRSMRREWSATGAIRETLPADARALGEAYAIAHGAAPEAEFRGGGRSDVNESIPFSIGRTNARYSAPSDPISRSSSVVEATTIRPELAERLSALGIRTVGDLLGADTAELGRELAPRASAADVAEWRDQAALCHEVPLLMPVEAQLLVACGLAGRDDLASFSPVELWELVIPVAESPDGARILGEAPVPDLDTVTEWIQAARLRAA